MSKRNVKRLLIFLIFPILLCIPIFAQDMYLKIIGVALTVIYVALLVFMRDSLKNKGMAPDESIQHESDEGNYAVDKDSYHDDEESFTIVTKDEKPKVKERIITEEEYKPVVNIKQNKVKPPDLKERFEEIANEELPSGIGHDEQFSFVLEKVLTIIKESFQAHSALFFWYNKKSEKLTMESYVSNTEDIEQRKFDVEDDVLSKIVQKNEPELLSTISPTAEVDVIRYYSSPKKIKSFVGVPLFYDKHLIAVIALDSKVEDAFGIETIFSLGRFARLITILISLFEEKYSESIAQQRLNGLLDLITPLQRFDSDKDFVDSIEKSMGQLLPWDAFAFVYFDPSEQKFLTLKTKNKSSLKFVGEHLEIELKGTLVGKCVVSESPVKIDDMEAGDYIRFSASENEHFNGSFLAVPVVHRGQIYGVLCLEHMKKNRWSTADVRFLLNAASFVGFIIYSFSSQEMLKRYITIDIETKTLSNEYFMLRLQEELLKANDLKIPGSLVIISIDDFMPEDTLFGGETNQKVVSTIAGLIRHETNHFTVVGRLDENVFGVYFFNAESKDVFLWADKIRKKIARESIPVMSKQTTFTVSAGVCSTIEKTTPQEVLHDAHLALKKAQDMGGNSVNQIS